MAVSSGRPGIIQYLFVGTRLTVGFARVGATLTNRSYEVRMCHQQGPPPKADSRLQMPGRSMWASSWCGLASVAFPDLAGFGLWVEASGAKTFKNSW